MGKDWTAEDLQRQSVAAASLLAELADSVDGDDEFARDIVEGETNFFEACETALSEMDACDVISDGCAAAIEKLQKRKSRADARKLRLKSMLDQAFQLADLKSHVFPTATISIKKVPASLVIDDESKIPSRFFKTADPKLDRTALTNALKEAQKQAIESEEAPEEIPGASLSAGGKTIQIRKG